VVAQLLRLKLRLFANGFKRERRYIIGSAIALVAAVIVVALIWASAAPLHTQDDRFVRRVVIIGGSVLSLAAFAVPVMFVRRELIDPRALRGFNLHSGPIAIMILLMSLIGPLLLIIPIVYTPVHIWRDPASIATASVAAPLLFAQGVLSVRLGVAVGAVLQNRPRWSRRVRAIGGVLLAGGLLSLLIAVLPRITPLLHGTPHLIGNLMLRLSVYAHIETVANFLEWTPFGVLWSAPSHSTFDQPELNQQGIIYGSITLGVLLVLWFVSVGVAFRATHRIPVERRGGVPRWFRWLPSSPTGAIASRSFIYWFRDPRYRTVFGVLPFIPILMLLAVWIGGVPLQYGVLFPLPFMVLLVAWATTHNDVALDHSAVWTHVVAQTRGSHDRVGRIIPVLVFGAALIVVGVPLSAWASGDWSIAPALLGVCIALLLGGVGVSSAFSARFAYPATRPGDSAFQQPQVSGNTGGGTQAGSFLLTIVVAAPAIGALVLSLLMPGYPWNWIALLFGVVAGIAALLIGVRAGGTVFDRRGPELLAFTMQN
jgi:ABC-2 type transport system permease protein